MNEQRDQPRPEDAPHSSPPARVQHRRFSFVWLIPIVAAVVAGYLAWQTFAERGPMITITFRTGEGIVPGQTQVKHKAVELGTVESIHLSDDMSHVTVRVRMRLDAGRRLTTQTQFWVVRPRLTAGNISGLETLVSGSYIEMDPGTPNAPARYAFTGLEEPPGIRSDEPGRTYLLKTDQLGSLGPGSPVFYRDVQVGEVLNFDRPGLDGGITLHVFIRSPYDGYVHDGSRFWNTSGIQVNLGAQGLQVKVASLQAALSGAVAFDTPPPARSAPVAANNTTFSLYADEDAANAAVSKDRVNMVSYFHDSVRGLAAGAPVELFGMRVGNVTDVRLEFDASTNSLRVPVHFSLERDRVAYPNGRPAPEDTRKIVEDMVGRGLRAQLQTSSYITGQQVLALDFFPSATPAKASMEGEEIVVPGESGDIGNITKSLNDIVSRIDHLPLDQIAQNLNNLLASVNGVAGDPELKRAVHNLSTTLASAQDLIRRADNGLTPVLKRLPELSANLDETLKRAASALNSVNAGYGQDSEFRRSLERLMAQANDTVRSVRLLADFLDRHPEALIRGRVGEAAER